MPELPPTCNALIGFLGLLGLWLWISKRHDVRPRSWFEARVVLVTGCDSGFGRAVATEAAGLGFTVCAACFTEAASAELATLKIPGLLPIAADLTTEAGYAAVVAAARAALGRGRLLHALVNNAGRAIPANIEWAEPSTYRATFDINFHAPVALTYELLPELKRARGRVLNVTSVDGFLPLPSNAAYNASKHALEAFSDTLRCEMRPWGVEVVVIEPATMRTPLAMAFADAWLAGFQAAPPERMAEYGEEWGRAVAAATREGLQKLAADPRQTARGRPLYASLAREPQAPSASWRSDGAALLSLSTGGRDVTRAGAALARLPLRHRLHGTLVLQTNLAPARQDARRTALLPLLWLGGAARGARDARHRGRRGRRGGRHAWRHGWRRRRQQGAQARVTRAACHD